jgi:hypothetical protein
MFRSGQLSKTLQSLAKSKLVAQCEGLADTTDSSVPSLVEQVGGRVDGVCSGEDGQVLIEDDCAMATGGCSIGEGKAEDSDARGI